MVQSQEPVLGNHHLYANVPSNNDRAANDTVLYSGLQSKESDVHTNLPTGQTSSPTTLNTIDSSKPNVVYGNIVESREPVLENANVPSNRPSDAVLYSELKSKDNGVHKAAPSGDLYAQVQRRNTQYPT